jgi:ABC-type Fe3+-hydroxamate transport system substrate-binding protein
LPTVGGTKNPDLDAIIAFQPDIVLLDREENRSEDADVLLSSGVNVHATHVRSVADVAPTLDELAAVLGIDADPPDDVGSPPEEPFFRAWIPIWRRPWMTLNAATYGSSLLAVAGIGNVIAAEADAYPKLGAEEAARRRPDLVLAPSEPYPFSERHRAELEEVAPVVFVDGQDLFWWGARTPLAAARLRQLAAGLASR